MKKRKILSAAAAIAMSAAFCVTSLAACSNKGCDHKYRWTTEREATCTETGMRRGVCGICGDVAEENLAVNPENHAYGEWDIVNPTETATGTAVKTCSNNSGHVRTVTLPVITEEGNGYASSEITTPPTSVSVGVRHFVFADDAGPVEFDIELPKRGLENVEDAVLMGASMGHLVREARGRYTQATDGISNDISCYYGDDYVHVTDSGNRESFWYTRDDAGNLFGVAATVDGNTLSNPHKTEGVTDKNLLGYGYAAGEGMMRTYGAEDTLLSYYKDSQRDGAVKYTDFFEKLRNGDIHCKFSYSRYTQPYFSRYAIDFTIDSQTKVIKNLRLDTKIFRAYMIADTSDGTTAGEKLFDKDGDIIFAEIYPQDSQSNDLYETVGGKVVIEGVKTYPDGTPILDRFGKEIPRPKPLGSGANYERKYYSDDHSQVSNRFLVYDEPVLKTPDDVIAENPYPAENLYVRSFDVSYRGAVIGENGVNVPSNTLIDFNIVNIMPSGQASLDYDPLKVYIRTSNRDIYLDPNGGINDNEYHILGGFIKDKITLNARYAGEILLAIKTASGSYEKEIKVNIEKGAPDSGSFSAQVYQYSDASGQERHVWTTMNSGQELTLYVGQPLFVKTAVSESESAYIDTSFTVVVPDPSAQDAWKLEDNLIIEGQSEPVSRITANRVSEEGNPFVVYLRSTKANVYVRLFINVVEQPDIRETLNGEYSAKLQRVVLDGPAGSADVTVTFNRSASNWMRGTINIVFSQGDLSVYSYEYNRDTGTLSTEYESGRKGETLDFSFTINEVYKISMTHSLGLGDRTETVVLARPAAE